MRAPRAHRDSPTFFQPTAKTTFAGLAARQERDRRQGRKGVGVCEPKGGGETLALTRLYRSPPQDQAARALFIASELKLPGFYNALANDAQFVKTVTRAVLQQLTVDQAFANELYAASAAYVQTQAPVIDSKPQCKRFFQECLGWP